MMRTTVTTEEELAKAIKDDDVDEIVIEGSLKDKIIKIRAKGKVAWAVAIGAIGLGALFIVTSPATAGAHALASLPALGPAIAVLGAGATISAVHIAVAAGGVTALAYLRDEMKVIDEGPDFIVLKKADVKKFSSFAQNYNT